MKAVFFTICILFSTVIYAQKIDGQKLNAFISHIETNNRGIGSVSIFKDGKEVYNRSFGQSNLEGVNFNSSTKYQIGSVTKLITATLIMKLVEDGKITLDDKLFAYYPEIPNAKKITIKNLLEHSSGLGDFTMKHDTISWLTEKISKKDVLNEIVRQGVTFEPDEKTEYSNSAYYLLTGIVEKKYKKPYAALVEEHIAGRLLMKDFSSVTPQTKNVFKSYSYTDKWKEIQDFDFSNVIGVGDIASTTKDLNTFITGLFQGKILKTESIETMKPVSQKEKFGRGLMLLPFYEIIYYGHGGDTYGTHTITAYNERDKIAISFSINGERYLHNDFAIGLLSILYDKKFDLPVFTDAISFKSEDLVKFEGVYASPALPIKITIFKKDNVLYAKGTGQPEFPLEAYAENKFKFDPAMVKLEFKPQEKTMLLDQGGMKVEMKKE